MSKLRSDSTLASLTEDQRDQLYNWLCSASYAEVIALAAKPLADGGFDLKLHRTTLARFFEHEQRERQARELAELAAAADNADTPAQIESLIRATRERFTRAAYELAKSAASDRADFDRLQRALHSMDLIQARREDLELKKKEFALEEIRVAEQRRQWEFDAAREVMKNFVAYEKIHRRRDINEHAKIWKARDVAFGKPPAPEPSPAPSAVQPSSLSPQPCQNAMTHSDTQLHANSSAPAPLPPAQRCEVPIHRDSKSVQPVKSAGNASASSAVPHSGSVLSVPPVVKHSSLTHSATHHSCERTSQMGNKSVAALGTLLHDNSTSPVPQTDSVPASPAQSSELPQNGQGDSKQ